jgi:hypothetical protein
MTQKTLITPQNNIKKLVITYFLHLDKLMLDEVTYDKFFIRISNFLLLILIEAFGFRISHFLSICYEALTNLVA